MTDDEKRKIEKMIGGVECELIDFRKDYRRELNQFKLNRHGDLLIKRNNRWEILIEKSRLTEGDWIAHLRTKQYIQDYGDFIRAYGKALEKAGVKTLTISIYGFDSACKFADE